MRLHLTLPALGEKSNETVHGQYHYNGHNNSGKDLLDQPIVVCVISLTFVVVPIMPTKDGETRHEDVSLVKTKRFGLQMGSVRHASCVVCRVSFPC